MDISTTTLYWVALLVLLVLLPLLTLIRVKHARATRKQDSVLAKTAEGQSTFASTTSYINTANNPRLGFSTYAPPERIQDSPHVAPLSEDQSKHTRETAARMLRPHAYEIKRISEELGIAHLVHFTQARNLPGILRHGLMSRQQIQSVSEDVRVYTNDDSRLDAQLDYMSLSISFPNYKLFYVLRMRTQVPWVVLLFSPDILWFRDCVFCTENAASSNMRSLSLRERKQPTALTNMFADTCYVSRRNLNLPRNYPTNPQAEVLVRHSIGTEYLTHMIFENYGHKHLSLASLTVPATVKVDVQPHYFSGRLDYRIWQSH